MNNQEVDYVKSPNTLSARDFQRLSSFIEKELGIRMPPTKKVMLESRLSKRLRTNGIPDFPSYIDFLFSAEGEKSELFHMIDAVTTNKTDFFRESDHFDYLLNRTLPIIYKEGGGSQTHPVRLWSAGCSTGEEPYTIAMVMEEYKEAHSDFCYEIHASDISVQVLDKAKTAIYEAEKADPIPMSYKKKYLLRSNNKDLGLVRIKPALRAKVNFFRLNLMDPVYEGNLLFDIIFCRNVIIYFDRPTQEKLIGKFCGKLKPGGFLFLGHSETLAGMSLPLKSLAPTIYQRVAGERRGTE